MNALKEIERRSRKMGQKRADDVAVAEEHDRLIGVRCGQPFHCIDYALLQFTQRFAAGKAK